MDYFMGNFVLDFVLLLIALLTILYIPIDLAKFTGLYVLLVALKTILCIADGDTSKVWPIVIIGGVGLVFVLILTGIFGGNMGAANYQGLMATVGLFPWYLGLGTSIIYVAFILVSTTIVSEYKLSKAFKSIGVKKIRPKVAKRRLTEAEFSEIQRLGSSTIEVPVMISAVLTAILIAFFG